MNFDDEITELAAEQAASVRNELADLAHGPGCGCTLCDCDGCTQCGAPWDCCTCFFLVDNCANLA